MATQPTAPVPAAPDLATSVAGEEDPGASIDMTQGQAGGQQPGKPGDQAPAGTPGTGENVCPRCGGSGQLGASACPDCQGTGKVTVGIGGG